MTKCKLMEREEWKQNIERQWKGDDQNHSQGTGGRSRSNPKRRLREKEGQKPVGKF